MPVEDACDKPPGKRAAHPHDGPSPPIAVRELTSPALRLLPPATVHWQVSSVYRLLLWITATLLAFSFLGQMLMHLSPDLPGRMTFSTQFDVDREQSLPTLFSIFLHLAASLSAAMVAWTLRQQVLPQVRAWLMVSAVFVLTMIDEQVGNHEKLIQPLRARFDASGGFHYAWVIVGIPVAGLLTLIFLRPVLALPRDIRKLVVLSAALFLGGALGAEMLGGAYVSAGNSLHSLGMEPFLHLEEGLEMVGLSTFIYALLSYRVRYFGAFSLDLRLQA